MFKVSAGWSQVASHALVIAMMLVYQVPSIVVYVAFQTQNISYGPMQD